MATFITCVRSTKKEFNSVYIRIIHNGNPDYIKTSLFASKKQLKGMEVKDNVILVQTNAIIKDYIDKLNAVDNRYWNVQKVKQYLLDDGSDISFTKFFKDIYLKQMSKDGRDNPAKNYRTAYNSLIKFITSSNDAKELAEYNLLFKDMKIKMIKDWIKSLSTTARAKNLYPYMMKAVFDAGLEKYNEYDTGILLIRNNPFRKGMVPETDEAEKRAIPKRKLKRVLTADLSNLKADTRPVLAQDVAKMVFYLAGINTVDLFEMEKNNYISGKLKYMRHKTTKQRKDKARFEIVVPNEIKYLLKKYEGNKMLFDFSERYSDFNSFNYNLNKGFKKIAEVIGFEATTYTFRHTWSTMAQNNCGFSTEQIGFGLNHASAHRETELYIDKDFSLVDVINRKVIDYVNSPIKRKVKRFVKKNRQDFTIKAVK